MQSFDLDMFSLCKVGNTEDYEHPSCFCRCLVRETRKGGRLLGTLQVFGFHRKKTSTSMAIVPAVVFPPNCWTLLTHAFAVLYAYLSIAQLGIPSAGAIMLDKAGKRKVAHVRKLKYVKCL